jgi:hypothetical protein
MDDATRQRRLRNEVKQSRQPRLNNSLMPLSFPRYFWRVSIEMQVE